MTTQTDTAVELRASGLVLDGAEQVHLCASLFYFRLPREVWADRLAQVVASGYTLVDVYVPWNFHETAPGRWDFTGRRDVGAFLDLARDAGLGVIARPGPYICSEWDGGALPAWLTLEDGLAPRQAEPRYLAHVAAWFDQVMPLLAARQRDRGGAVVAVQVENELDFFDTADRPAYLTRLRDLALRHGVGVPLVACAGQGDLLGATGGVDGILPAFNFYPDDRSRFVEPEVRRYAELVAGRGEPLLVTETNRLHATLRRLLVSGAKLLAPYLQASGFDFGYTPSVGNWGDPGGYMSHDYDFGGYLDPVGAPRPEMADARVLARVLRTLGPALARATPASADGAYRADVTTSAAPSRLLLDGGGELVGIPNLTDDAGTAVLPAWFGGPEVSVPLPAASCLLVLRDLPLDSFGLPGTLRLASADLVGAGPDGLELSAVAASVIVLESPDEEPVLTELAAPTPGAPVRARVDAGVVGVGWDVVVRHPLDLDVDLDVDPDVDPDSDIAASAATDIGPAAEHPPLTVLTRLDLATRTGSTARHDLPPTSEALGVYRGRTHYAADVGGADELLVEGASDIVDLALDGVALPTVAGFGATFLLTVAGAARLDAIVETWGHANFDDVRLPALRLGALRGIGRVWSVVGRSDVSALWQVSGQVSAAGSWPGDPAPLRTLGGWSSTRAGEPITYTRGLPVDGTHHHALRLDGIAGSVSVTVDGVARTVTEHDPWLHLTPGEGHDVAITVPHLPGASPAAELLLLEPVRGWDVEPQPDEAILALSLADAVGEPVPLPLELKPGEERWFDAAVPPGGLSIGFEGAQVRVSAFAGGELLGRVWLDDPARPRFTGGDAGRLWLPAAWNAGTIRFLVHGTRGEESPVLSGVRLTATRE
ncbi:beta-galactosidase [Promicromonospora panici]|uniref:beta-galactosidase n=1 Tax=Promicromonospora panici TaxID=2219658 RepID=UPI00101DE028|nr:beta-galactosidase [Promicromonospora panici]